MYERVWQPAAQDFSGMLMRFAVIRLPPGVDDAWVHVRARLRQSFQTVPSYMRDMSTAVSNPLLDLGKSKIRQPTVSSPKSTRENPQCVCSSACSACVVGRIDYFPTSADAAVHVYTHVYTHVYIHRYHSRPRCRALGQRTGFKGLERFGPTAGCDLLERPTAGCDLWCMYLCLLVS